MIRRLHHVILDCPDPQVLAQLYSALLGHPVTHRCDDFSVVAASSKVSGLAFQRIAQYVAPTWPDQAVPQRLHLDVMVDDVEAARPAVVQLGAHLLNGDVDADPAGHPFCLIPRPSWADSVS